MLKYKHLDWGTNKVYVNYSLNRKMTLDHSLLLRPLKSCPIPMSTVDGVSVSIMCASKGSRALGYGFLPNPNPNPGLGSAPNIHMEGTVETEVQLVCTAKGWFPEPQVYWKDITGEELLTVSEHHIQDEDGLFYVEATLVIRNASLETVSCFIHNHILNEEKGSVISIPGQCSASRTKMLRLTGKISGTVLQHVIFFY